MNTNLTISSQQSVPVNETNYTHSNLKVDTLKADNMVDSVEAIRIKLNNFLDRIKEQYITNNISLDHAEIRFNIS